MTIAQEILASIEKEIAICQHLFTKIPADQMEFRPSASMRSVTELLQYLSVIGASSTDTFINCSTYEEVMTRLRNRGVKETDMSRFPELMELQKERLRSLINDLSNAELLSRRVFMPSGEEVSLLHGLMNGPLKWLTAYKMQLFLYAKMLGADLNTANAWRGIDWKPQPKPEAQSA